MLDVKLILFYTYMLDLSCDIQCSLHTISSKIRICTFLYRVQDYIRAPNIVSIDKPACLDIQIDLFYSTDID